VVLPGGTRHQAPPDLSTDGTGPDYSRAPGRKPQWGVGECAVIARPQLTAPDPEQSTTGALDQRAEQALVREPTVVSIDTIAEPQDQPARSAQPSLRDLPFDEALTTVQDWFAALPISKQSQVLEALEGANNTVKATARQQVEKAAA
jgi:hypothetical protein